MRIFETMYAGEGRQNIKVLYGLGLLYESQKNERKVLDYYRKVVSHPQFSSLTFQDLYNTFNNKIIKENLANEVREAKEEYDRRIKEARNPNKPIEPVIFNPKVDENRTNSGR